MYIYEIKCLINNKSYVGKSKKNIEQRFQRHIKDAIFHHSPLILHRAMRKYGEENFEIRLLETVTGEDSFLAERERYWIKELDTFNNGYNMTEGGEGGNTYSKKSEEELNEIRQKISNKLIGDNNGMRKIGGLVGERNGMYGKTLTEEHKRKMSLSLRGKRDTEETRKKKSLALKGKPKSENHRIKNRELNRDKFRNGKVVLELNNKETIEFEDRYFFYDFMIEKGYSKSFCVKFLREGQYIMKRKNPKMEFINNAKIFIQQ